MSLHNQEEQGFLTGLKIPAPWSSGKTIESIHPVRDNYKFKETVHIPGARCLYLRFDSRCSSQYDYDKVMELIMIIISHIKNLSLRFLTRSGTNWLVLLQKKLEILDLRSRYIILALSETKTLITCAVTWAF